MYSMGMPKDEKKSRSGTSFTYAERKARGRPTSTYSLSNETIAALKELADHLQLSKSAVIELAVRELQKKYR
jgi:predicted ArsR family transcriptional regulator